RGLAAHGANGKWEDPGEAGRFAGVVFAGGGGQSGKPSRRENRGREPEEFTRVTAVLEALEADSVVAAGLAPNQMAEGRSAAFLGDWRGSPLRGLASSSQSTLF